METERIKDVLQAAGRLALAADLVVKANTKNLSDRVTNLENALNVYNNEIVKLSK